MKVLADATNVIAEGEVLQLMNVHDADTDEEKYLRVIRYKTAKLFEAATQVGAILGGAPPEPRAALARVRHAPGHRVPADRRRARLLGRPARDRQEPGRRPRRGQAHAAADPRDARRATRPSATLVRHAIEQGGKADLEARGGGDPPRRARSTTRASSARAEAARRDRRDSAPLPDSACRDSLLQLAHFSVERKF